MKNVKKLFLGLLLLCSLSSGAFAKDYGYFWVAGARGFYDDINMGDDGTKYVLSADKKGVPDINKIIRIEAKNRMYWDLNNIQDISKEFSTLLEQKICGDSRYAFTVFMTNIYSPCSIDNLIKKMEKSPIGGSIYAELTTPIKAKVLGYVKLKNGLFILVEQIEVLEK